MTKESPFFLRRVDSLEVIEKANPIRVLRYFLISVPNSFLDYASAEVKSSM